MEGNTSAAYPLFQESLPFKVFKIALYSVILSLCILGNSLVVLIISTTKRMRMPSNLLILNLAICDLITPIASIPFDLALEENSYVWPFGRILCKSLWPLATLSATAASLTLALISLDRYRAIMHPFKQRLSATQIKICIGLTHFLGLLFVLPYAYHLDLLAARSCEETWPAFSYRQAYTLFLYITQYGIPLVFMAVMYTLTLRTLHASSNKFENTACRETKRVNKKSLQVSNGTSAGNINGTPLNISLDERKSSRGTTGHRHDMVARDQNIRATKMFVTVVIVFATCRLPNEIFWLWSDFGDGHESEHSNIAGIICRMFTYTNSVFNPVIYWAFSKDFKRGFKEICCWKRKRDEKWDDSLVQRYRKLSTLSETISFAWRKKSSSRSESPSCYFTRKESQPSLVSDKNFPHCKRPKGCQGESSIFHGALEIARKRSLGVCQDFSCPLTSQSKLSKVSEESLSDICQEVGKRFVNNKRTRRYGTVQFPEKYATMPCKMPSCNSDSCFWENTCLDDGINLTLAHLTDGGNQESDGRNEEKCIENDNASSDEILLSAKSKTFSEDGKNLFENIKHLSDTQSSMKYKEVCDYTIIQGPVELKTNQWTPQGVTVSVQNKQNVLDKEEGVHDIITDWSEPDPMALGEEIEFVNELISRLIQNEIKETSC